MASLQTLQISGERSIDTRSLSAQRKVKQPCMGHVIASGAIQHAVYYVLTLAAASDTRFCL